MKRLVLHYRYWPLFILVWSLVVLGSLYWNKYQQDQKTWQLASERASFVFKLVEATRLWAARHGGVYVPVTEQSPPNPWLKIEHRDFTTDFGLDMTMVNPAYMTRQLGEVVAELSDLNLHMTSLNPVNPANAPDDWERRQLELIRDGVIEAGSEMLGSTGDQPARFRHLAPLYIEEPCLKCHAHQGYELGDLRGAVSISFSGEPLKRMEMLHWRDVLLLHGLVWLLLSVLTLLALARFRQQMLVLEQARAHTEQEVVERTAELADKVQEHRQAAAQLRLFIDSSGEGILGVNMQGICTLINPEACRLLGYEESAVLGAVLHDLIHCRGADEQAPCAIQQTLLSGGAMHEDDDVFWRADGSSFPVEYRSHPLHAGEQLIGAVITFNDVSARKERELQLQKMSSALEHSPSSAVITNYEGLIEYVNPSFVRMTGYQAEEVLGKNPRILQSGQVPSSVYKDMRETLMRGEAWDGELLNKGKDGRLFWEHARISPMLGEDGKITHFIAIKDDITLNKEQEQSIWEQAHHDALTGLPNRSLLDQKLAAALQQAQAEGQRLAVLYVDLDGFKQVNDSLGHAVGDLVLVEAAQRLRSAVRTSDTVARLGGDEFVLLLEKAGTEEDVVRVADKVVRLLGEPWVLNGSPWQGISASVGIAIYPQHGAESAVLLQCADAAMYKAKQAGRNGWVLGGQDSGAFR